MWIRHIWSAHSPADEHLGSLTIVDNAAVNIHVQVWPFFGWIYGFNSLGSINVHLGAGLLSATVTLRLTFRGTASGCSTVTISFCIPNWWVLKLSLKGPLIPNQIYFWKSHSGLLFFLVLKALCWESFACTLPFQRTHWTPNGSFPIRIPGRIFCPFQVQGRDL